MGKKNDSIIDYWKMEIRNRESNEVFLDLIIFIGFSTALVTMYIFAFYCSINIIVHSINTKDIVHLWFGGLMGCSFVVLFIKMFFY